MSSLNLEPLILFAVLGLIVGSFVNVLIHRLPIMILQSEESLLPFSIWRPRVHTAPIAIMSCIGLNSSLSFHLSFLKVDAVTVLTAFQCVTLSLRSSPRVCSSCVCINLDSHCKP